MNKKFTQEELELIHYIFERELRPPFRRGRKLNLVTSLYYNKDDEFFGILHTDNSFLVRSDPFFNEILVKIKTIIEFDSKPIDLRSMIKPILRNWLKSQLNIEINRIL